jgi:hypothetical protein
MLKERKVLELYDCRVDLQQAYPEVRNGDLVRLIGWTAGVSTQKWEDSSYESLRPYAQWFSQSVDQRLKALSSLEKWSVSRKRWCATEPDHGLIWGKMLDGRNFILKVSFYDAFGKEKDVIQIGPSYGRLLKAMLVLTFRQEMSNG